MTDDVIAGPARRTQTRKECLWAVLDLTDGSNVLDVPRGYRRIARALAERGAQVLGGDLSMDLL